VIAVGRGGDGEPGGDRGMRAETQIGGGWCGAGFAPHALLDQSQDRIGSAEGLEAPQAESLRLVFIKDAGESGFASEIRERVQRGRRVIRP
jgi:hypothetical protein